MRTTIVTAGAAAAVLTLAVLGDAPRAGESPEPTVQQWMAGPVAQQSAILWDVSSNAYDDDGKADGARLSAEDWTRMAEAADLLERSARSFAEASAVRVAAPGVRIQDEGGADASTAAEVQGFIDQDPAAFRGYARGLAANASEFAEAARRRDAAKLIAAAESLEPVCEACHSRFWYPQQAPARP